MYIYISISICVRQIDNEDSGTKKAQTQIYRDEDGQETTGTETGAYVAQQRMGYVFTMAPRKDPVRYMRTVCSNTVHVLTTFTLHV